MGCSREEKCYAIIHGTSITCGIIGASPVPGADAVPIVAAQMAMIIALGALYGVNIEESYAKVLAKGFAVKQAGKYIAGSFCKLLPGFGSAINASVAFSLTEALGWETVRNFESGCTDCTAA